MMNGFGTSEITFCLTKNLDKSDVAIAAILRRSTTLLKIAAWSTFAKGGSQTDQFFAPPALPGLVENLDRDMLRFTPHAFDSLAFAGKLSLMSDL